MDLEACYWLESEACACAHILRYVGKVLRQAWVPHSLPLPYPSSCPSELPKGQAFFVLFQDLLQDKAQLLALVFKVPCPSLVPAMLSGGKGLKSLHTGPALHVLYLLRLLSPRLVFPFSF